MEWDLCLFFTVRLCFKEIKSLSNGQEGAKELGISMFSIGRKSRFRNSFVGFRVRIFS